MERERERSADPSATRGEEREPAVGRSQNVMLLLPQDSTVIPQFLSPALERLDRSVDAVQMLVITPDVEMAISVAGVASRLLGEAGRVVPATRAGRAARLLRSHRTMVVTGAPPQILELVRGSVLKLEQVRIVVLAWADAILDLAGDQALEGVMAELPKDGARVLVASQLTPAVEQLAERYARRARRVGSAGDAQPAPLELKYFLVSAASRPSALRRVLDELDPPVAAVFVRSDEGQSEVRHTLRALGYSDADPAVRVSSGEPAADARVTILYELPETAADLARLAGTSTSTVVALVQPRQLGTLRALTGGGRLAPLQLAGPMGRARLREDAVRAELRGALRDGAPARELLALEPLLDEFDGVELAAAALRLLERDRESERDPGERESGGESRERGAGGAAAWTRIFVGAGARDNIAVRDLVGAISNEAGIRSDKIGKVELRDTHSLIEIATPEVDAVVRKINGTVIRGRRVAARIDRSSPRESDSDGSPRRPGPPGREGGARERGVGRERPGSRERGGGRDAPGSGPRGGSGRESRASRPRRPGSE